MKILAVFLAFALSTGCAGLKPRSDEKKMTSHTLVLMTDFGIRDGAVSAMKGVAHSVSPELNISDLSHHIEPFNIWEAAYRLHQTTAYWPPGTVFVTVVDPGVGSTRRSIVAKSRTGQLFVNPDNGLLTLIAENPGIESVRIIDETRHRLKGSELSYTFHGRDLYMYTGAKLASGQIRFEEVGAELNAPLVRLNYQKAEVTGARITGFIPALDINFGNVWTNIPRSQFLESIGSKAKLFKVQIFEGRKRLYSGVVPLGRTFNDVPKGEALLYFNSLLHLAIALNQTNFAERYKIKAGAESRFEVTPVLESKNGRG